MAIYGGGFLDVLWKPAVRFSPFVPHDRLLSPVDEFDVAQKGENQFNDANYLNRPKLLHAFAASAALNFTREELRGETLALLFPFITPL